MGRMLPKYILFLGYISQGINIGYGLFLVPFVLYFLDNKLVVFWYVFISVAGLINIVEMGFSANMIRNVSYARGGLNTIQKEGVDRLESGTAPNYSLLKSFLVAVKKIYFYMSIIVVLLLVLFFKVYLSKLVEQYQIVNVDEIYLSAFIYGLAIVINLYYLFYTSFLLGMNKLKENYISNIVSKISLLVLSLLTLYNDFGLIGLAFSNLVGIIVLRLLVYYYFWSPKMKLIFKKVNQMVDEKEIIKNILPNSIKMFLVGMGSFLVNKSTPLIAALFLNADEVVTYSLTVQVLSALVMVSMTYFTMHMPTISLMQLKGHNENLKLMYRKSQLNSFIIYIIFVSVLFLFGNDFLQFLGKQIVDNQFFILLISVVFFLELNHSLAASLIVTENRVPFVGSSLLSGIAIVVCSFIVLKYTSLGLIGLALIQGVIQLAYNNWKWPLEVEKKFRKEKNVKS